jgi:hypothetical protein
MGLDARRSMRPATKQSFSGAKCAYRSTISYDFHPFGHALSPCPTRWSLPDALTSEGEAPVRVLIPRCFLVL